MRDNAATFALLLITGGALSAGPKVDFARDVQPILHSRCSGCHSGQKPQANLSVLTRSALLTGGISGPAVKPGASGDSLLIRRVTAVEARMPLGQTPLTDGEVGVLRLWIDEGAVWNGGGEVTLQAVNTRIKLVQPDVPPSSHPNTIDAFIERDLRQAGSRVPVLVDDAVFARRVYFDLIGLPPDAQELNIFVRSGQANKRELLVDELLNRRDAYAEHWMSYWNDLLRNEEGVALPGEKREWITRWLFDALKRNMPYDRMAQELLAPERPDSPRGFLAGINWGGDVSASQSPAMQAAQNSAQVFLGANLRCASCHDSFVSRWKLSQTFGLAAYFTTDRLEIARCDIKTGASAAPAFLFPELREGEPAAELAERRRQVARMFTSPANGRFAATLVNRYWKLLFGQALVEPLDDIEAPAWDAGLLSWLAADLMANHYDIQMLLRRMVTSRAYQMESAVEQAPARTGEAFVFRGPLRRRLSAEQYCDAVAAITGEWKPFDDLSGRPAPFARQWRFRSDPLTRALGRPSRVQVVTERSPDATTLQALELVNGEELRSQLRSGAARLTGGYREPPRNTTDSGQVRLKSVQVEANVRGADRVWLLLSDFGSYDRSKVLAGWMNAEFEGPEGVVRLRDLPLPAGASLGSIQIKDATPREAIVSKSPGTAVYDIRGKGFTKFRALVGLDESGLRPEITAKVRFFVFVTEPGSGEYVRTTGDPPVPRPKPDRGESLVRNLFLHAVARQPSPPELSVAKDLAARGAEGVEDLLWILVMSPEFQFIR